MQSDGITEKDGIAPGKLCQAIECHRNIPMCTLRLQGLERQGGIAILSMVSYGYITVGTDG